MIIAAEVEATAMAAERVLKPSAAVFSPGDNRHFDFSYQVAGKGKLRPRKTSR